MGAGKEARGLSAGPTSCLHQGGNKETWGGPNNTSLLTWPGTPSPALTLSVDGSMIEDEGLNFLSTSPGFMLPSHSF